MKIIQIIPAEPGTIAWFEHREPDKKLREASLPVIAWGLDEDGLVHAVVLSMHAVHGVAAEHTVITVDECAYEFSGVELPDELPDEDEEVTPVERPLWKKPKTDK